ncbi:MAG: diguanylate cyclase [Thermoleophilia bacterium]
MHRASDPAAAPVPGDYSMDWGAAARTERRLQAVQVGVLVGLALVVAAVAFVLGRGMISELDAYRSEETMQTRLDALRFQLQDTETAFWRYRSLGGDGVPPQVARTVIGVAAETQAVAARERAGGVSPAEERAIQDTLDGLGDLVAVVAGSGDLGEQGSAADRRFIARLAPVVTDLKAAAERWGASNLRELARSNTDVSQAAWRLMVITGVTALGALLLGLVTWRLVGRERRRIEDALRAAHDRLRHQADTDPLTGLGNQRMLHHALLEAVATSSARRLPLSVVMLDLDHFKTVNDTHGHPTGDRVLVETATRLKASCRPGDVVARIGGEEFLLVLAGADAPAALEVAERIRLAVRATPYPGGVGHLTASLGVATLGPGGDADSIVEEADAALYWAKSHGRDVSFRYSAAQMADLSPKRRARQLARVDGMAALRALARAIDAKDPNTQRHSIRVADMAVRIAGALGWTPEQVARLREAGLLHDVGKVGVPDAVLLKPGRLTPGERALMQEHAPLGARIVSEVLEPDQVEWVAHHHERWDGGGYPDGLAGTAIPEGARILALADAWDAMTSARSYNVPLSPAEALTECRRCAGAQLWTPAVDALERLDGLAVPEPQAEPEAEPPPAATRTGR